MSAYGEKLKDPRWQKKRLEILERDKWKCKSCGSKETTLHVHHIFYMPKTEPWEIPNGILITFCEDCHKLNHAENQPGDLIDNISRLLNLIWEDENCHCYAHALGNAYYVLKPE